MSQLDTLEAKMAKIEVSLSTLGLQQQQQHHQFPLRRKRNSMTPSSRSLHSVPQLNSVNHREALHFKEMEFLKQNLKDKEQLILSLQDQMRKLSKRKLIHGSSTSTDSGVMSLRILNDNERKGAEERLGQLDKEMEVKRAEIKRINHRLERLDPSENIDVRIQQAELEYDLEREELNLMNMQEDRRNLHTILDDNDAFQKRTENSLFASMPANNPVALLSFEVLYDAQNPSFAIGKREDRTGTYVTWTRDDLKTLKRGDRIIEINGTIIISNGVNPVEQCWLEESNNNSSRGGSLEEFSCEMGSNPFHRIVVMRAPPPLPPPRVPNQNRELHTLKEEVTIISTKLEQVNDEKREIQSLYLKLKKEHGLQEDEIQRIHMDCEKSRKECDALMTESVRLRHRISYLDEQVAELLHRKDLTNSVSQPVTTVFQKGNQKTIVADSKNIPKDNQCGNSPSRPTSVACNRHETKALKTRLWETFRRATTSDSRSVCSVDSRWPTTETGYFKKRSSESKKLKPNLEPPQKPIRVSLQRATSTNNMCTTDGESREMIRGLKRSNYSENTLLPDWVPSNEEVCSEVGGTKRGSANKHGIRWPSLRPASSMTYTMANRENPQAVKF